MIKNTWLKSYTKLAISLVITFIIISFPWLTYADSAMVAPPKVKNCYLNGFTEDTSSYTTTTTNFNSVDKGGRLCNGIYSVVGSCWFETAGGCGGSSCGYSIFLRDRGVNVTKLYGNTSPGATHGNPEENTAGWAYTADAYTLDTNDPKGPHSLSFSTSMESGVWGKCRITAALKK